MSLKYAKLLIDLNIILNLLLQQLVSYIMFTRKVTFYGSFLKSVACSALVRKGAEEIRTKIILKILRSKETT
jgi:hypothetical protein